MKLTTQEPNTRVAKKAGFKVVPTAYKVRATPRAKGLLECCRSRGFNAQNAAMAPLIREVDETVSANQLDLYKMEFDDAMEALRNAFDLAIAYIEGKS